MDPVAHAQALINAEHRWRAAGEPGRPSPIATASRRSLSLKGLSGIFHGINTFIPVTFRGFLFRRVQGFAQSVEYLLGMLLREFALDRLNAALALGFIIGYGGSSHNED